MLTIGRAQRGANEVSRLMNRQLLTPREAATSAGVSSSLVYQWCRDQLLPHYRFGTQGRRGKILIAPSDLEAFMQQCRVERHVLLDDLE
jgi:excisionase family DNA binding protein